MECVRPRNLLRRQPPLLNERYACHAEDLERMLPWRKYEIESDQLICGTPYFGGNSSFAYSKFICSRGREDLKQKELKSLIATAKTPADHLRIANYYREQAAKLTASSNEHVAMAKEYAKNPVFAAVEAKQQASFGQGASHCRRWAELDKQQAKEAEALVALHEEMAKAAEQKQ
jgi:hypothetical protein